jgi:hypothetical protein
MAFGTATGGTTRRAGRGAAAASANRRGPIHGDTGLGPNSSFKTAQPSRRGRTAGSTQLCCTNGPRGFIS